MELSDLPEASSTIAVTHAITTYAYEDFSRVFRGLATIFYAFCNFIKSITFSQDLRYLRVSKLACLFEWHLE